MKVAVANVLRLFAEELLIVADVIIGFYQESVLEALEFATKDRVLKVQQAARGAIKEWKKLKEAHKNIEAKKMLEEVPDLDEEELIKMRLNEEYKKTPRRNYEIKDEKQTVQFLKKKMGTGGGYVELTTQPIKTNYKKAIKRYTDKVIELPEPQIYTNKEELYKEKTYDTNEYNRKEYNAEEELGDTISFGSGEIDVMEQWRVAIEKSKKGDYEGAFSAMLKCGINSYTSRLFPFVEVNDADRSFI
jgi:hypothetical protein